MTIFKLARALGEAELLRQALVQTQGLIQLGASTKVLGKHIEHCLRTVSAYNEAESAIERAGSGTALD